MHDQPENSHMSPNKEEAAAFLRYTLHHSEHHGEELLAFAHELEHLRCDAAAREVRLCAEDMERGCEKLRRALAELEA